MPHCSRLTDELYIQEVTYETYEQSFLILHREQNHLPVIHLIEELDYFTFVAGLVQLGQSPECDTEEDNSYDTDVLAAESYRFALGDVWLLKVF